MITSNNFREGIWRLSSYGIREGVNEWRTTSDSDIKLVLKVCSMEVYIINMNLFLNCGKKLVESFSLISNDLQRMIHKDDTMAFVFRLGAVEVRYLKIKFEGMAFFSGEAMCKQCADILSHYIPTGQNAGNNSDRISNETSVSAYLTQLLRKNPIEPFLNRKDLSSIYPLEEMIDEFILDNNFPSFVTEVANILSSKLKNK